MQSVFVYRAVSGRGTIDRGRIDATSVAEAREILARRGLLTLQLRSRAARAERRERLSAADLALGLRILADLLDSGLPVGRALYTFDGLAPAPWKRALPHVRQAVREGNSLAAALDAAPLEIPPLVVGITYAGEAGSGIGPAVRRAAELTEATAEMQAAVRSALAYPAVVGLAGVGAVTVLVTVVLPRFAMILRDLGQTLPTSTRLVLDFATAARAAFLPAAFACGALIVAWTLWAKTTAGRLRWHRLLLQAPVVGSVRRALATARMAHSLSALLDSGAPMGSALSRAARASRDAHITARIVAARERIASGESLSHALEACGAVTLTAVRLIRAGEESGRLSAMLGHAARIEQQRADRIIRTAVRMLEPMLLLAFASIVA